MKRVKIFGLVIFIFVTMALAFIYIHWTAYCIEAHHIDYESVYTAVAAALAAFIIMVISYLKYKSGKKNLYKYMAIISFIILIECIYAAIASRNACCPICNYVYDDKWYPIFYQLFKGKPYERI